MKRKVKVCFGMVLFIFCISTLLLNVNVNAYADTNLENKQKNKANYIGSNDKNMKQLKVENTKQNELNLTQDNCRTLDANLAADESSFNIIQNSFEGLTRFDYEKNKVMPGMAKSWKVSNDGLTWTFYLRNAKWSDGKPVTAYDFEYSWKRLLNSSNRAVYSFYLTEVLPIRNAQEYFNNKVKVDDVGIKAVNNNIFQIILSKPIQHLLSSVSFPILYPLRKDIVEKKRNDYGKDTDIVYNGPYVVTDWQNDSKVVLEKNKNYWDAKNVKIDKVNFIIPLTIDEEYKMFKEGKIDRFDILFKEFQKDLQDNKQKFKYIQKIDPIIHMIYFNSDKNIILKNAKIRRALSLAIDRENYVKGNYVIDLLRNAIPAYSLISPQILCGNKIYRKEVTEQLEKNEENPKKLFIEGLKELGMDEDPSKVTFHYLALSDTPIENSDSEFLKTELQNNIGCKIVVDKAEDFSDFLMKLDEGEFEMALSGWIADYNDPSTFLNIFKRQSQFNPGKYCNIKFERICEKLISEMDTNKRIKLTKEAEDILVKQDPAIIPLYYGSNKAVLKNYVKGLQYPLFFAKYELKWASVVD